MQKNNCCPHCGSEDITIDIDIRITASIDKNGQLVVKDYWYSDYGESINDQLCQVDTEKDMGAFCHSCGAYLDIKNISANGITFSKVEKVRKMDKKYMIKEDD